MIIYLEFPPFASSLPDVAKIDERCGGCGVVNVPLFLSHHMSILVIFLSAKWWLTGDAFINFEFVTKNVGNVDRVLSRLFNRGCLISVYGKYVVTYRIFYSPQ